MPRAVRDVKQGDPMGFKLNKCSNVDLDKLIEMLKCYHNGQYIVGYDTSFVEKPHYHIHWFSAKEVTEGALKTFRSGLGRKLSGLTKADKLYVGQVIEADERRWIGYAIKEAYIQGTIEPDEETHIYAKASFENKRQKHVYGQQKATVEKEKKEFKDKLCEYVKNQLPEYKIPDMYVNKLKDSDKVRLLVIKYLMENERSGSLKKGIIDSYVMHCNIKINKWDEFKVLGNLYLL